MKTENINTELLEKIIKAIKQAEAYGTEESPLTIASDKIEMAELSMAVFNHRRKASLQEANFWEQKQLRAFSEAEVGRQAKHEIEIAYYLRYGRFPE